MVQPSQISNMNRMHVFYRYIIIFIYYYICLNPKRLWRCMERECSCKLFRINNNELTSKPFQAPKLELHEIEI